MKALKSFLINNKKLEHFIIDGAGLGWKGRVLKYWCFIIESNVENVVDNVQRNVENVVVESNIENVVDNVWA